MGVFTLNLLHTFACVSGKHPFVIGLYWLISLMVLINIIIMPILRLNGAGTVCLILLYFSILTKDLKQKNEIVGIFFMWITKFDKTSSNHRHRFLYP